MKQWKFRLCQHLTSIPITAVKPVRQPMSMEMDANMDCYFPYYSSWQERPNVQTISLKERIKYDYKKRFSDSRK